MYRNKYVTLVREDPFSFMYPPHSTGHSGTLFLGPYFTILKGWIVLLLINYSIAAR